MMRKTFLLLACLPALSNRVLGQEAIYVHGNGLCQAFDANNTSAVIIDEDTVCFGTETTLYPSDIDSITFKPTGAFIRTGWWGDVCSGRSTYNHQWNYDELPIMEMTAADSICLTAWYYVPTQDYALSRTPYKVGKKWRYVRNTLTGRHKLQLAVLNGQALSSSATPGYGSDGSYTRLDLSDMVVGKHADDIKRMVSYWHHPTEAALRPSGTVIGTCQINDYSKISSYNTMTFQDSIRCQILFWVYKDEVTCDTMRLFFRSSEEAQAQFEQMDTRGDEYTWFELWENQIVITEHFQATLDEVKRWLTRFDFEMAQPIIIRKE